MIISLETLWRLKHAYTIFQIIGEAVSRLPNEVKEKEVTIPWSLIKGMRNRLIHEYFGTDLSLVWDTIKKDLPSFKIELERIRSELLKREIS